MLLREIGVGGETITFEVSGRSIGQTLTGGDGWAYLEYSHPMRGNHTIVAKVEPSPRVSRVEATGVLALWERRRPILLIDVNTLFMLDEELKTRLPGLPSLEIFSVLPAPAADASSELQKLGKFYYNLVYLARGDARDVDSIRRWLTKYEFPVGLTKTLESAPGALESLILELKEGGWENIEAGIGLDKEFAEVLVQQRIRAVILDRDSDETFPRRAKMFKQWKDVRKHL